VGAAIRTFLYAESEGANEHDKQKLAEFLNTPFVEEV